MHSLKASLTKLTLIALPIIGATAIAETSNTEGLYQLPDSFDAITKWSSPLDGKRAQYYRNKYRAHDYASGNDIGTYAYLNINQVITTVSVARSGDIAALTPDPKPHLLSTTAKTKLGELSLEDAINDPRSRLQGMIIAHKGKISMEVYPGMQSHQKHVWNSASKTITGVLIHQLLLEEKLDLNATVDFYLPEFKEVPLGKITVANLLHHRSGLDMVETQSNIENPKHPLGLGLGAALSHRGSTAGISTSDILMSVGNLREDQGLVFDYSSFNTQVLGMIIEKVENRSLDSIMSSRVWSKVGMERDALVGLSQFGEILNGGIIASTLRDMARFAIALSPSSSTVASTALVGENYYQRVSDATDLKAYQAGYQGQRMIGNFGADSGLIGSSYQWDAVFADGDMYKAGLGGQGLYVSPRTDTVVVWFSSTYRNSLSIAAYARAIVEKF